MDDRVQFFRMTRPMKFRKVRRLLRTIHLSFRIGVNKVLFNLCNLLYKLNILKLYTYSDAYAITNVREGNWDYTTYTKELEAGQFFGIFSARLEKHVSINEEYFYLPKKNGMRKKVFVVNDMHCDEWTLHSFLSAPGIVFCGNRYQYGNCPKVVRVFKAPNNPEPFNGNLDTMENMFDREEIVEYDLGKLFDMQCNLMVDPYKDRELLQEDLDYLFNSMSEYLRQLTLRDIEV